jgi:hypothetical protein
MTMTDLEIRKRLAGIEQLNADAALKLQEFTLGYRKFYLSAVATAAGLMGAGAAFVTLLQHL